MLLSMRHFLCALSVIAVLTLVIAVLMISDLEKQENYIHFIGLTGIKVNEEEIEQASRELIPEPIILWWTGFTGERGAYKQCGEDRCFFTAHRRYMRHPMLKVFVFYGTDLKISDLPLPRQPHHEWAVLHEESPKNNILFSFQDMLVLFNHTCTFRRESDYAITTQHLKSQKWLQDTKYMKSTHDKNAFQKILGLAPLIFTHSDCNPPSDRDHYVQLLMKHIPVDSYGRCLNNRRLPESLQDPIKGMEHNEFFDLVSKYKFSLAMENAVCKDYITEKLWRPLVVGSVPVIFGSPNVKDMLPSDHSGVVITDFATVENLARFLHYLNHNDSAYEEYLNWKLTGITNPILKDTLSRREWSSDQEGSMDFVTNFECFICKRLHENRRRMQKGLLPWKHVANESHYGCPVPHQFDENGQVNGIHKRWMYDWSTSEKMAKAVRQLVEAGKNFTMRDLEAHLSLDL